jgi:hypothetical protein
MSFPYVRDYDGRDLVVNKANIVQSRLLTGNFPGPRFIDHGEAFVRLGGHTFWHAGSNGAVKCGERFLIRFETV